MPRVKRGFTTHRRHASLFEKVKGFRTGRKNLVKRATEALLKAGQFAYRDRRTKKREFRKSWIVRINAAVRMHDMTYSQFMAGMKKNGIEINRKMLSEMALNDMKSIEALIEKVK